MNFFVINNSFFSFLCGRRLFSQVKVMPKTAGVIVIG